MGRTTAALGAGYDRRTFIAAPGTVLAALDGLTDESYYIIGGLTPRDRTERQSHHQCLCQLVRQRLAGRGCHLRWGHRLPIIMPSPGVLVARAALAVDYFDSEFTAEDFAFATALLGLRYNF